MAASTASTAMPYPSATRPTSQSALSSAPMIAHTWIQESFSRAFAGAEVRLTELTSGQTQVLTPGWGTSWGARWSPDGRRLAFYSDRNGVAQLWLWERESGASHLLCEEPTTMRFSFEGLRWLPDGRALVAKLRAPGW